MIYVKLCESVPHCSKLSQSVINLCKMSKTYLGHSLAQFYTVMHTYSRLSTKIISTREVIYIYNFRRFGNVLTYVNYQAIILIDITVIIVHFVPCYVKFRVNKVSGFTTNYYAWLYHMAFYENM